MNAMIAYSSNDRLFLSLVLRICIKELRQFLNVKYGLKQPRSKYYSLLLTQVIILISFNRLDRLECYGEKLS